MPEDYVEGETEVADYPVPVIIWDDVDGDYPHGTMEIDLDDEN